MGNNESSSIKPFNCNCEDKLNELDIEIIGFKLINKHLIVWDTINNTIKRAFIIKQTRGKTKELFNILYKILEINKKILSDKPVGDKLISVNIQYVNSKIYDINYITNIIINYDDRIKHLITNKITYNLYSYNIIKCNECYNNIDESFITFINGSILMILKNMLFG